MMKYMIIVGSVIVGVFIVVFLTFLLKKRKHKKKGRLPMITQLAQGYLINSVDGYDNRDSLMKKKMSGRDGSIGMEAQNMSKQIREEKVLSGTAINGYNNSRKAYLIDRHHGVQLLVVKPCIVIGTNPSKVDFLIQNNRNVSGQHAILYKKSDQYYIMDNHSTNKTYVNEILLVPGEAKVLYGGEMIRVANITLEFMIR